MAVDGRELVRIKPVGEQEHGDQDNHVPVEEELHDGNQLARPGGNFWSGMRSPFEWVTDEEGAQENAVKVPINMMEIKAA